MSNQDTAVAYDEGIKDRDREGGRSWEDDSQSLAWLRLTETASALKEIQAEMQESFESANAGLTHSERRAGYRTCILDTQDNISNLQLRIANAIQSLETN